MHTLGKRNVEDTDHESAGEIPMVPTMEHRVDDEQPFELLFWG